MLTKSRLLSLSSLLLLGYSGYRISGFCADVIASWLCPDLAFLGIPQGLMTIWVC